MIQLYLLGPPFIGAILSGVVTAALFRTAIRRRSQHWWSLAWALGLSSLSGIILVVMEVVGLSHAQGWEVLGWLRVPVIGMVVQLGSCPLFWALISLGMVLANRRHARPPAPERMGWRTGMPALLCVLMYLLALGWHVLPDLLQLPYRDLAVEGGSLGGSPWHYVILQGCRQGAASDDLLVILDRVGDRQRVHCHLRLTWQRKVVVDILHDHDGVGGTETVHLPLAYRIYILEDGHLREIDRRHPPADAVALLRARCRDRNRATLDGYLQSTP